MSAFIFPKGVCSDMDDMLQNFGGNLRLNSKVSLLLKLGNRFASLKL